MLATRCRHCGANLPVVLSGPTPPCSYCTAPAPFSAEVEAKVARVRSRVAGLAARSQQLVGRQALLGRDTNLWMLVPQLLLWVVAFALLWWTFGGDDTVDMAARFWLLFATTTGMGASLVGFGITMIHARRMSTFALARPPLVDGQPPRCRVCGAALAQEGRVRRCRYCCSDHLVTGEHYRTADNDLDATLKRIGRELSSTLQDKAALADKLYWHLAGWPPLVLVVAVPIAALTMAPSNALLPLPIGLWIIGLLLVGVGSAMKVPAIRTREEAKAGDTFIVEGLHFTASMLVSMGPRPFSAELFLSDTVGLLLQGEDLPVYRIEMAAGGQPVEDSNWHAASWHVSLRASRRRTPLRPNSRCGSAQTDGLRCARRHAALHSVHRCASAFNLLLG